jgi:hypothetical protein
MKMHESFESLPDWFPAPGDVNSLADI